MDFPVGAVITAQQRIGLIPVAGVEISITNIQYFLNEVAMIKHLLTLASAVLLISSTILVFIPELRTTPIRMMLKISVPILLVCQFVTLYRSGVLMKTPTEIYRMPNKPDTDLLPLVAIVMCTWAMVVGQG